MIEKEEIVCPHCGKTGTWSVENKFRPFCSKRCKLIDLGDWASENHRVPGDETPLEDIEGGEEER